MAEYGVDPRALQAASEEGAQVSASLRNALESMNQEVLSVMGQNWTGEARQQYDAAYQQCISKAQQIPQIVNATVSTVQNANDTYVAAERTNAGLFGG